VTAVEIKGITLPENMRRAMAKEAEAISTIKKDTISK
jgi:regulator of protease activity HflC (stomatin/prohibitin superfamily)